MKHGKTTTVGTWASFLQAELSSTNEQPGPEWKSLAHFQAETGYSVAGARYVLDGWMSSGKMEKKVFRVPRPTTYYRPKEKQK